MMLMNTTSELELHTYTLANYMEDSILARVPPPSGFSMSRSKS
jgi:hypothetical protein